MEYLQSYHLVGNSRSSYIYNSAGQIDAILVYNFHTNVYHLWQEIVFKRTNLKVSFGLHFWHKIYIISPSLTSVSSLIATFKQFIYHLYTDPNPPSPSFLLTS